MNEKEADKYPYKEEIYTPTDAYLDDGTVVDFGDKKLSKKFKGIFPILYAFYNRDNSIDFKLMEDQINLIINQKSNGIACLGLATEVNKLSFTEKVKIIELVSKVVGSSIPKAITIQSSIYSDYKKLIKIAQYNNADWLILQPLIKNTTDKDCVNFFNKLLPL